jgi:hypothetical protein
MVELASIDDPVPPRHVKELQSDLSSADSLALFLHLQRVSDYFPDFTEEELRMMSDVFSVLRLPAGEKIISKGQ